MARPIHESIEAAEKLRQLIQKGNFSMGEKLPSETLLAQNLNVSRNTIRKALHVLEEEHIVSLVKNRGAFFSGSSPDMPPALIPFISASPKDSQLIYNVFCGVQEYFKKTNYSVLISPVDYDAEMEKMCVNDFISKGYENMIIMPTYSDNNASFYNSLIQNGSNLVFVDRAIPSIPCNSVTSNNFSGGYLAALELLELNCRNFFFIYNEVSLSESNTISERFEGFQFALKEKNIPLDIEFVSLNQYPSSSLIDALYSLKDTATGLFCSHDIVALQISNLMLSKGFYLPLVGFDHLFPNVHSPSITTIEQAPRQLGFLAAQILHERILSPEKPLCHYKLPVKLIKGTSTEKSYLNSFKV